MVNALWITLIGMGLVFAAILLLWGLMALLVRITAVPEEQQPAPEFPPNPAEAGEQEQEIAAAAAVAAAYALAAKGTAAKAAAAAVGVAIALASQASSQPQKGARQDSVSAWQAVHRASQLSQRMNSSRKKVVR